MNLIYLLLNFVFTKAPQCKIVSHEIPCSPLVMAFKILFTICLLNLRMSCLNTCWLSELWIIKFKLFYLLIINEKTVPESLNLGYVGGISGTINSIVNYIIKTIRKLVFINCLEKTSFSKSLTFLKRF